MRPALMDEEGPEKNCNGKRRTAGFCSGHGMPGISKDWATVAAIRGGSAKIDKVSPLARVTSH